MNERDAERERRAAQYEDAVEAGAVLPLPEGVQYPDERGKEIPRCISLTFEIDERGVHQLTEVTPDPSFGTVKVPQEDG